MATYTARINGVDRADTHVLLDGFQINEITNGVNTLVCRVASEDASYRPLKRQSIEIEEDDGTSPVRLIFAGTLRMVREHGWGMTADGDDAIILELSADSYRTLASRRFATETLPSGTLKAALQVLVTYLQDFGAIGDVTLDPAQVNGPTLDAIEFKVTRVDDCLNFLATLTAKYGAPYIWTIGYDKVLGMYQTGTVAAPWNLLESDFTTTESSTGDIEVEPTDDNYANKITVVWGNGSVIDLGFDGLNTPEQFVGDGVTNSFPLTYQLLGPIPPPPLTSPPTQSAVGYAFVNVPGGLIEFLAVTGTVNAEWEYDTATNSVSRVAGPPPLGYAFSVPYRGLLTGEVTAEDAAEIAAVGLWEDKILAPEIEDPVLAQSVANAELARRLGTGRIVRFQTRRMPAPQPGETITITVPKRNISGSFTVTDVATENDAGNVNTLLRRVTCNSTIHEQSHQTLTRWWSEKDTAGISQPAGASAVPDWPLNSVQFNDEWRFGGAAHVLYGDLFWDQPDSGETQTKGLVFVTNQHLGDSGHIGLTDPQRTEMGQLGSGDFSIDTFGVEASILVNATGDITVTAGTGSGSPDEFHGSIALVGHQSIVTDLANLAGVDPGVSTIPGDIGDSFTRFHQLNVIDGLAGFYLTVSTLPFTINTTAVSNTNEFLGFIVTANTGTIFVPFHANSGTPDYRIFPNTAVGRLFWIVNGHASGTLTVDAGTAGSNIGGDATITLASRAAVLIGRHDTGWKIWSSHGSVTGGGASSGQSPGGPINAIQYNNPLGTFDGEAAFTYDESTDQLLLIRTSDTTQIKVRPIGSETSLIGLFTADEYEEITFGRERVLGTDMARNYAPGHFFHATAGGSGASPDQDVIGFEITPNEDPGSPMAFAQGRGLEITAEGVAHFYQYGGLGSGTGAAANGCGILVDNNTDGGGAAGFLGLKNKDSLPYYLWSDEIGGPRWSDAPPEEDGSPADASGYMLFRGHIIVASGDESIANDTLQNDDELFFSVGANEVWILEMTLFVNSGTSNTPDFKWDFTLPASATIRYGVQALNTGSTAITGTQFIFGVETASVPGSAGVLTTGSIETMPVFINGTIITAGTAGTVQFRWAQNTTTGGTPTVRRTGSWLKATRIT